MLPRLGLSYVRLKSFDPPPGNSVSLIRFMCGRSLPRSVSSASAIPSWSVAATSSSTAKRATRRRSSWASIVSHACASSISPDEQRVLRLAVNRLAEKGQWDLDALKIEFEELIMLDTPIEIAGFSPAEIDHVILGDAAEGWSRGRRARPRNCGRQGWRMFQLGPHRIICGDATDPAVLVRLLEGDPPARLVLTDEPYNVRIAGNVTGGRSPRVRHGLRRDERR